MRVGFGYDAHRFEDGRRLVLCGTEIPFEKGLCGHSDADAAVHALIDAMLGSCALGDIGTHFPDSDDRYKGIDSMVLLDRTVEILNESGHEVYNIDLTLVLQRPRIAEYIPDMRRRLAEVLGIDLSGISVKAKTEEMLGFTGRGDGVKAYAVCTVKERSKA